ncbi:MAG: hypothetical protein IKX65_11510 [Prevotella sp.]|nr:hypothetical protein [Prevotella sp.]
MSSNVEDEIQAKWEQIVDLFQKNYDIETKRVRLKLGKDKLPRLSISDKLQRLQGAEIVVVFEDKTILSTSELSASDVFVRFIEKVGVNEVQGLGITDRKRRPLISDSIIEIEHMGPKEIDGKYVITKTGNKEKLDVIREIIDRLNYPAEVT